MEDQRMIDAQARLISRLNENIKDLQARLDRVDYEWKKKLDELRPAHDYYMLIQRVCLENDTVMSAWQKFLAMFKLAIDDAEDEVTRRWQIGTEYNPEFHEDVGREYHPKPVSDPADSKHLRLNPRRLP